MPQRKLSQDLPHLVKFSFPKNFSENVAGLRDLCAAQRLTTLRAYYQIGEHAEQQLRKFEATNLVLDQDELLERIAADCGAPFCLLRDCLHIRQSFSRAEYKKLIAHQQISKLHILHLCEVSHGERDELVRLIVAQRWTPDDLLKEILRRYPPAKPRRERVPWKRQSIRAALKQFHAQSARLSKAAHRGLSATCDLVEQIKFTPPDDLTNEVRTLVVQILGALESTAQEAAASAKQVREDSLAWIDRVLAVRANAASQPEQPANLARGESPSA